MGYEFRMGKIMLPVPPSGIQFAVRGNNKKIQLINEGEFNIIKKAKLTEISFEFMLPNVKYPFAKYKGNKFVNAFSFLKDIEDLKNSEKPFTFIINRSRPNGKNLYDFKKKVVIEDYTIKENHSYGLDAVVSIKLTQYREGVFKTARIDEDKNGKKKLKTKKKRQTHNAPMLGGKPATYRVKKGDSLWLIARKFYGDGSKYKKIAAANKDKIKRANLIYAGQVLAIPK